MSPKERRLWPCLLLLVLLAAPGCTPRAPLAGRSSPPTPPHYDLGDDPATSCGAVWRPLPGQATAGAPATFTEVLQALQPAFMTEGLVPAFSLNSFPVFVLDRKAERAWLRWPGGRLDSAARLRGPAALPVDWSRYSFLGSSVAPGSHLLPPDVWAQTGSPLLALDCTAPLNSGGVGDLQGTLVHEGFHLYYQRVGWEDMSAMAPPGSESSLVPNRSALRLQLEQHFREPRYATALFAEITALRSARSHFGAGHTAAGLAALHNFLSLRRDRRRELSLELFFGEDYWEYTEGVAYFVEQLYRRTVPGLVPPRVDLGEGIAPGYFIDSGALIAAALECWEPGSLLAAISPGRPLNLTRLLASRLEGRTRH